jgi:methylphosphotriester-DNA--protein-cysteine methyltransferase
MKKIKVVVSIIASIVFLIACLSLAADYKYVGSKNSNKYHYPDCKWAKKISPKNLLTFKTAQEALAAGYVPCKVCKPSTKD